MGLRTADQAGWFGGSIYIGLYRHIFHTWSVWVIIVYIHVVDFLRSNGFAIVSMFSVHVCVFVCSISLMVFVYVLNCATARNESQLHLVGVLTLDALREVRCMTRRQGGAGRWVGGPNMVHPPSLRFKRSGGLPSSFCSIFQVKTWAFSKADVRHSLWKSHRDHQN